jgi:hypothetical protein
MCSCDGRIIFIDERRIAIAPSTITTNAPPKKLTVSEMILHPKNPTNPSMLLFAILKHSSADVLAQLIPSHAETNAETNATSENAHENRPLYNLPSLKTDINAKNAPPSIQ